MSTIESTTTATTSSRRVSGGICAAGGALTAVVALTQLGSTSAQPSPGLDPLMGLILLGVLMTGVGIVAVGQRPLLGRHTYARVGLGVALVGTAVFAVAHLVAFLDGTASESPLFPVGQVLQALGMVVVGIGVLRARRWRGWGRLMPLISGIYPIAILMPAFAIFGSPNFPAIVGFGLVWLVLGIALATAASDDDVAARVDR
jgi:hypothetical protein